MFLFFEAYLPNQQKLITVGSGDYFAGGSTMANKLLKCGSKVTAKIMVLVLNTEIKN